MLDAAPSGRGQGQALNMPDGEPSQLQTQRRALRYITGSMQGSAEALAHTRAGRPWASESLQVRALIVCMSLPICALQTSS